MKPKKSAEKDEAQLLAIIPAEIAKAFRDKLVEDGYSYKGWLMRQIKAYLKEGGKR